MALHVYYAAIPVEYLSFWQQAIVHTIVSLRGSFLLFSLGFFFPLLAHITRRYNTHRIWKQFRENDSEPVVADGR